MSWASYSRPASVPGLMLQGYPALRALPDRDSAETAHISVFVPGYSAFDDLPGLFAAVTHTPHFFHTQEQSDATQLYMNDGSTGHYLMQGHIVVSDDALTQEDRLVIATDFRHLECRIDHELAKAGGIYRGSLYDPRYVMRSPNEPDTFVKAWTVLGIKPLSEERVDSHFTSSEAFRSSSQLATFECSSQASVMINMQRKTFKGGMHLYARLPEPEELPGLQLGPDDRPNAGSSSNRLPYTSRAIPWLLCTYDEWERIVWPKLQILGRSLQSVSSEYLVGQVIPSSNQTDSPFVRMSIR